MTDTYTDEVLGATWLAQDDNIVHWLRQSPERRFEPVTTSWMLAQMAARGGAYVDVGASTGWFAVPFALRGYTVHAFECNPRAVRRLKDNCVLNGVSIMLHECAASHASGQAVFTYNPRVRLTSGGSLEYVAANTARETVATARLDDIITEPVGLLKIDVEGHEISVLHGAERLIGQFRPSMVLEANTAQHRGRLVEWLADNDYDWLCADTRNLLCTPRS